MARRTPTPTIKGNLPPSPDYPDEPGRELPSPPVQWYERADPRSNLSVPSLVEEWAPPPTPPPGYESRYSKGGMVKHGSPTRVTCSNNKMVR
jgi:hypothetical protein